MINEKLILSAMCQSRTVFTSLSMFLTESDLSHHSLPLYKEIVEFYDRDKAIQSVDLGLLKSGVERKYPKHAQLLISMLEAAEHPISEANVLAEVVEFKRFNIGQELAGLLLNPKARGGDIAAAIDRYKSCELSVAGKDEAIINKPISELANTFARDNLLKLYPSALNERVDGGVPLHTHIGVFGCPESGKTLFSINMAAMYARTGFKVLYVGNEDPVDNYLMRLASRLIGMPRSEILSDPKKAQELLDARGWSNLIFDDGSPCTFYGIERLINKYEPTLVIIDQIRQVSVPKVDGEVQQLTAAVKEARRFCKAYPIVTVSVTQAADSASNKLVLDMGDVYMSNTSYPGDVDILIGWGTSEAFDSQNRRMISLPKNKIGGIHDHFPVLIDPATSKVINLGG